MTRLFRLLIGATTLAPPCALALACATTSGAGSETHFVCSRDADCADVGSHCVAGKCVRDDPGTGGRGTAGSGAGGRGAGGRGAGGQAAGGQAAGGSASGGG